MIVILVGGYKLMLDKIVKGLKIDCTLGKVNFWILQVLKPAYTGVVSDS